MLVKSDERDVVFFTGGGEHGGWEHKGQPPWKTPPAAVKFALDGDKLTATVLWSGIEGRTSVEFHAGIVYQAGRLYHPGGVILDAATGKIVAGKFRDRHTRATPAMRHLLWIAGERIYGVAGDRLVRARPRRCLVSGRNEMNRSANLT
jgi:hypothetical protein